ncbi:DNA independent RNA polymerase I transcription factor [Savitreella phatthalungensis]
MVAATARPPPQDPAQLQPLQVKPDLPAGDAMSDLKFRRRITQEVVQEAFRQRAQGNDVRFDELQRSFVLKVNDAQAPTSDQLQLLLYALTQQISYLDRSAISLVRSIIDMNWLGRSDRFVAVYAHFLGSLVTAHADFATLVIQMLARNLTLIHSSVGQLPSHKIVSRETMHARVHSCLSHILSLVPVAKESLVPVLLAEFPHKSEKTLAQTTFIENLLKLTLYIPDIEAAVIAVIIDKIISIDVEIQVELEDMEDVDQAFTSDNRPAKREELSDDDEDDDKLNDDEDDAAFNPQTTSIDTVAIADDDDSDVEVEMTLTNMTLDAIRDNVRKLDHVLAVILRHLSGIFDDSKLVFGMTRMQDTFGALLIGLDQTILRTYQSRYTQFILFWAAQKQPVFIDDFLGCIMSNAMDTSRPATQRMIAAAYIGSFTARAKTLTRQTIRMLVSVLANWLNDYIDTVDQNEALRNSLLPEGSSVTSSSASHHATSLGGRDANATARHGVFYSMCQALFYIFCFRHRTLRGLDDEVEPEDPMRSPWCSGLQATVERAVYHRRLNPLRHCNAAVVAEFSKFAYTHGLVYCAPLIAHNNRTKTQNHLEIDGYFPFDPFRLNLSSPYIEPYYVEWTGLDDDDDDEEESDEDDDDDDMMM